MIKAFDKGQTPNVIKTKIGDSIRIPFDASFLNPKQTYGFKIYKDGIESNNAKLVPFRCSTQGNFKVRIKSFDNSGLKQFSINIDGEQLGKVFRGTALTLNTYTQKILKHFQKLNSWDVTSRGNILQFQQNDDCNNCGKSIDIGLGTYNLPNQNKPKITSEFVATENVIGSKCYQLDFTNIQEGNRYTVQGVTYIAENGDTEESMRIKILGDSEFLCIQNTDILNLSVQNGFRIIQNLNKPRILAKYSNSDATYDYYEINTFDVREGNIFIIGNTQKVASSSDTQITINAFFNAYSGLFRIAKGTAINPTSIASTRTVINSNVTTITGTIVSNTATMNRDKYLITIFPNVQKGNVFVIDKKEYIAKDGDTDVDIAYNLAGANNPTFFYYLNEGLVPNVYCASGYARNKDNIADIQLINQTVCCCDKNSMILEFEANAVGCYNLVIQDANGKDLKIMTSISVLTNIDGEMVYFSNNNSAYGIDFDKLEMFNMRLPIFLRDINHITTEEVLENINGDQSRGKTTIQNKRDFVTKNISTDYHDFMIKVLKCDTVIINDVNYAFIGDYNIDEHRQGLADIRQAKGTLIESGGIDSNMKNCTSFC